jgi:integrase
MKGKITKRAVDALAEGELLIDTEIRGFVARRLPSGTVTFGLRYHAEGKRRWMPLGILGEITPDQARAKAESTRGAVARDRDPLAERLAARAAAKDAKVNTVDNLLDVFLTRYARKHLRSATEVERVLDANVRPSLGTKSIYELSRRDIVEMLDAIEDRGAPVMADRTLAYLRKALNWWATRDDKFNSPIIRGMARTKPAERARRRILDDQEIRDLWRGLEAFDEPAAFGPLVKVLLLTAQRRNEIASMRWSEISGDALVIPAEKHKTGSKAGDKVVPLTPAVLQLLGERKKSGFVLSTTGGHRPISGFSKARSALDERIAGLRKAEGRGPLPHWVLHDLRRTARSLMARAGVSADVAERVLGHVMPGVRGVYDRHDYAAEKRDALERLAIQIERILHPAENVVALGRAKATSS